MRFSEGIFGAGELAWESSRRVRPGHRPLHLPTLWLRHVGSDRLCLAQGTQ